MKLSEAVTLESDGKIATITFDNPSRYNALAQSDWQAIPLAIAEIVKRDDRVIIIRGEGSNFCAGADITEFDVVRKDAQSARFYEAANSEAFAAIRNCPVPTLARIDGYCLGGGFGIAAACDLRFASEDAQFAIPAARLGLAYPIDAMGDIVRAVGEQMAKCLLYTATRFDAGQMLAAGFLSDVVSAQNLDHTASETASQIAELAPLTHRSTKAAIAAVHTGDTSLAQALGDATFESADYAEGRAAFREKRKAVFKNA